MKYPTPKIYAPDAKEHNGPCISFHSYEAGHQCVECGKWKPADRIDAMIAQSLQG